LVRPGLPMEQSAFLGECGGGANMLCSFPYMIGVMLENAYA
jgi:hypothetical protein